MSETPTRGCDCASYCAIPTVLCQVARKPLTVNDWHNGTIGWHNIKVIKVLKIEGVELVASLLIKLIVPLSPPDVDYQRLAQCHNQVAQSAKLAGVNLQIRKVAPRQVAGLEAIL